MRNRKTISRRKILITGATGFIGGHLVSALLKKKYEVYALNYKSNVSNEWLKNDFVKIFKINITKEKDFSIIPRKIKFDAVFHLAAYIPPSTNNNFDQFKNCLEINALGTFNLLKFCQNREINKIINSSTVSVYNNTAIIPDELNEKFQTNTVDIYGYSKLIGEQFCQAYVCANTYNANTITLRYSSVYGVNQNLLTVLPIFISRAKNNQDIIIYGNGNRAQDFVYIKDVIKANLLSLKPNVSGVYNIGSGQGVSMARLAKTVIKIFKSRSKIIFDKNKKEGASNVILDISNAKKYLKYNPDYQIEKGLKNYCKNINL